MYEKQPQIQIIRTHVDDSIRIKIMDFIRYTNQERFDIETSLKYLKQNLEEHYQGKWQVIIGEGYTAHMDEQLFPHYLQVQTRENTYLIFSRGRNHMKIHKQQDDLPKMKFS